MGALIALITEFFTALLVWAGQILTMIVAKPILLLPMFLSIGFGLFLLIPKLMKGKA